MSYRAYATEEDICNALCKHKIGDNVTLLSDCRSDTGIFEAGTTLYITDIKLRDDIHLNKIYIDEIYNCEADEEIFRYELMIPDNDVKLSCNGDKLYKTKFRLKDSFFGFLFGTALLLLYTYISKNIESYIVCTASIILVFVIFFKDGIRDKPNIRRKRTNKNNERKN